MPIPQMGCWRLPEVDDGQGLQALVVGDIRIDCGLAFAAPCVD